MKQYTIIGGVDGVGKSSFSGVLRRYEKRFSDLTLVLPYCDEVHFYDNENGFQEVAVYQNGELILLTGAPPTWLTDFAAYWEKTDLLA